MMNSHNKAKVKDTFFSRLLISYISLFFCIVGFTIWYKEFSGPKLVFKDKLESIENSLNDSIINLKVYVKSKDLYFPDIVQASQIQIDSELRKINDGLQVKYTIDLDDATDMKFQEEIEISQKYYLIEAVLGPTDAVAVDDNFKRTIVLYTLDSVYSNDIPFFITQAILYHVFENEFQLMTKSSSPEKISSNSMSISYSSNVNLNFVLINGKENSLITWDIEKALDRYFTEFRFLSQSYINFTIFSDVLQEFDQDLLHSEDRNQLIQNLMQHGSTFQADNLNPTLNFILYTVDTNFSTPQLAFLPQWGGISFLSSNDINETRDSLLTVTADDLQPYIESSVQNLMKLLGLPQNPRTPILKIDIAKRYQSFRLIQKSLENLSSLDKLLSTSNSSWFLYPNDLKDMITDSLNLIDKAITELSVNSNWDNSIIFAWEAFNMTKKAYFHKMIVSKTYLPRLSLLIYSPLVAPIVLCTLCWSSYLTYLWLKRIINDT